APARRFAPKRAFQQRDLREQREADTGNGSVTGVQTSDLPSQHILLETCTQCILQPAATGCIECKSREECAARQESSLRRDLPGGLGRASCRARVEVGVVGTALDDE